MKLGMDIKIEQSQKLVMTPELIQAIKILQFNKQELDLYVNDQLLANPVLESYEKKEELEFQKDESISEILKEYTKEDYKSNMKSAGEYYDPDKENNYEQYISTKETLQEHLELQLNVAAKSKTEKCIGKFIIESLDENGYMTSSKEEIAKLLDIDVEMISDVVYTIQNFDPIGVCAENLVECLTRQLEQKGELSYNAEIILNNYLEDFAANRIGKIAKNIGISIKEVQEIGDLIRTLNPRPGMAFDNNKIPSYIVPDIFVEKTDEGFSVRLNDSSSPQLMVSAFYKSLLNKNKSDEQLSKYLTERIESAVWLVKSIEQRKNTILEVAKHIVKHQEDFFLYGSKHLKTLTLKQVAENLEVHESTVSRAISGKYLECDLGVFELKYFFSAGVSSKDGEESISSNSVKNYIKDIVEKEDPKKPYSDQKIVNVLKEEGIDISRRTVAKYRDEMGILSSSKRKRY